MPPIFVSLIQSLVDRATNLFRSLDVHEFVRWLTTADMRTFIGILVAVVLIATLYSLSQRKY